MAHNLRTRIYETLDGLPESQRRMQYRIMPLSSRSPLLESFDAHNSVLTTIRAETTAVDENGEERRKHVRGYGSVFNRLYEVWDWWEGWFMERMLPGCFARSIRENRDRIKGLWMHNMYDPVATFDELREDSVGLFFDMLWGRGQKLNDYFSLVEDEIVTEVSIGFNFRTWRMIEEGSDESDGLPIMEHEDVDLWEISPVTWGANSFGGVTETIRHMGTGIPAGQLVDEIVAQAREQTYHHRGRRARAIRDRLDSRKLLAEVERASQYYAGTQEQKDIAALKGTNPSDAAYRFRLASELSDLKSLFAATSARIS